MLARKRDDVKEDCVINVRGKWGRRKVETARNVLWTGKIRSRMRTVGDKVIHV